MREQKMWVKLVTIHNRMTKLYMRGKYILPRRATRKRGKKVYQQERIERELEDK
jgi:hypothetical protein